MPSRIRTPARLLSLVCLIAFGALTGSMARCRADETSVQFYFVQITDIHFGKDDNKQRAQRVNESINGLPVKVEFVAQTGDLTHEKLADETVVAEAIEVLGALKVPVHHVPGNHDMVRRKHDTLAPIYKQTFGEFITEREYHGVVCLFVYTEPLAKNFKVEGFAPLKELREKLNHANGKPVLVFHHTPSVEDFYKNRMHPGWDSQIRTAWIGLLNEHNVKGVFAGHFHRDEFHWLGKVPLYVSSSVGDTLRRNRQATYRLYEYKDGRISYRTQYVK